MKPEIGQRVTCRHPVEAYYSDYGPNRGRKVIFEPGMIGTVAAVSPKVCLPSSKAELPPGIDRRDESVVIDYVDAAGGRQRASLNFCNVEMVCVTEKL